MVLVKFRGAKHVSALRVEPERELESCRIIAAREDVEFAELDVFQQRASAPDDPLLTNQWHHQVLGSYWAWDRGIVSAPVRVAIVDTPFQMDHPDLVANVDPGWDVVEEQPVVAATGINHSTLAAGLVAATVGNHLGVAGVGNCRVLPLNVNGAISEIYNAVIWAADHGVRVVNVSWTGADSDTLNAAGAYLKTKARGLLVMAGVNGTGFLDYPNQPDIWCVSMTDSADNQRSRFGHHIDFAAPGWDVFSTAIHSSYGYDSGTSFSTPVFAGVAAVLFGINPTLGPDDVISVLKATAADQGAAGWDMYFGWGRIDFGAAAEAAWRTRPVITSVAWSNELAVVSAEFKSGLAYSLWRASSPADVSWERITNAVALTQGGIIQFTDPQAGGDRRFYRIGIETP